MSELERRLKAMTPDSDLDRDRVLFEAGRRSAPRPIFWPLATLVSSACAIGLGLCLALRSDPPPAPPPPPASVAPVMPSPPAARRLEEEILDHGLDGLGPTPPLGPAPAFLKGDF
jgi:hypothetical protein